MKIRKFLKESAVVQIISAVSRIQRSIGGVLSSRSLTLLQSLILISLFFEETDETRPKELHLTFRTTKGNISHCLSRLEELKLLKRVAEVSDRRGCYVRLTKKGEELSRELIGYFDELENSVEATLAPVTGAELGSLLKKVGQAANLSKRGVGFRSPGAQP